MPKKMTVESVHADIVGETEVWRVLIRDTAGSDGVTHIFPKDTLDWRAAEYGIDPTDVDTLLDVILHEPHLQVEASAARGVRYADGGPDLWTAESTEAARTAHLERVKSAPTRGTGRGAEALDAIRAGHRPDLDRIRGMREAVDTSRWIKRHGGLPVARSAQQAYRQSVVASDGAGRE